MFIGLTSSPEVSNLMYPSFLSVPPVYVQSLAPFFGITMLSEDFAPAIGYVVSAFTNLGELSCWTIPKAAAFPPPARKNTSVL